MGKYFHFIQHLMHMVGASGKKRIVYAFANIVIMAIGIGFALAVKWLWNGLGDMNFFAWLLGMILCVPLTVYAFLWGFVAQIVLVFVSGIGIFHPEERAGNAVAFVISLLTTVGLIVALVILLQMV